MARRISNRNFLQSSGLRNRVYCSWSRTTAPTYRKDVFRMASQNLFEKFDHSGRLLLPDAEVPFGEIPWTAHPAFEGVSLKPLVCSKQTGGQFSFHLVRIAPNREIGLHVHAGQVETHEVVSGSGICINNGTELRYAPGVISIFPVNQPHRVTAGPDGLCLFAKFIPALE